MINEIFFLLFIFFNLFLFFIYLGFFLINEILTPFCLVVALINLQAHPVVICTVSEYILK